MVSVRSPSAVSSRIQSSLSEFLVVPTPPGARKQPKKPQFARVLTSSEYLKGLERKEKEKREKEEEKEKKRKEREEKARMRAEEKQRKIREREERARINAAKKAEIGMCSIAH